MNASCLKSQGRDKKETLQEIYTQCIIILVLQQDKSGIHNGWMDHMDSCEIVKQTPSN